MAYYQTQPLVPNAYYVDIIGGSTANQVSASAVAALESNVQAQQAVIDPVTATANINFLTAATAGASITVTSPLALSNNVTITTQDTAIGAGAGFKSAFPTGGFIGINGVTGSIQAGFAGAVEQTVSTTATHYMSTNGSNYRLTVEGAIYASSFNTLCPYRVLIDNREVLHVAENGDMYLKEGAQIYIGGRRLRLEGLLE
jgi:hypothetical protein